MASEKIFRLLIIDFGKICIWWFELVQCECGIGTVLWWCVRVELVSSNSSWLLEDCGLCVIEIASFFV